MFLLIVFLFICICVLSVYTVYKVLEIEKDVETLYDKYAKEMEKLTKIKARRTNIC